MRQLSRKPVAKGTIYCSPHCGAGCTKEAYNAANQQAGALANYLGKRWKPRVWENLGWHYEVSNGKIHVLPMGDRSYWARIDIPAENDGCRIPQFSSIHKDARLAVAATLKRFDAFIDTVVAERKKISV